MSRRGSAQAEQDEWFCWEQIDRTRPGLRLTLEYVRPRQRAKLLGVYAWLALVEQAVSQTSEASIARTKLGWWHQELTSANVGASRHPAVRMLSRSGALGDLDPSLFTEEIHLALRRVDKPGLKDIGALLDHAAMLGKSQLRFESSFATCGEPVGENWRGFLVVNGLMQMFRESTRSSWLGCWWLPLTLCARHDLPDRGEVGDWNSKPWRDGMQDLLTSIGAFMLPEQLPGNVVTEGERQIESAKSGPHHWVLMSMFHRLQWLRLGRGRFSGLSESCQPGRVIDAWRIWRLARVLGMRK